MKGNNKAFTLIELLVVVLIIGILAAVALPQYQKAVEKARVSEAKLILKAMDEAQQVCVLERGDYWECAGDVFFENSSFMPPTPILDEECLDTSPCFHTKDWEYFVEDLIYAVRIKNGRKIGRLSVSTAYALGPQPTIECAGNDEWCALIGM